MGRLLVKRPPRRTVGLIALLTTLAPYVALAVTIAVWISTQRANRKHEVFKERVKRRVDMFDGLLPTMAQLSEALSILNKSPEDRNALALANSALKSLGDFRVKMLCYGTTAEKRVFEEFVETVNKKDMISLGARHNTLVGLATQSLRKELDIH